MSKFSILPKWPDWFDPSRGDDVPAELIGAKIITIGSPIGMKEKPEGGGLIIEYVPAHSDQKKVLILGFNELGMWVDQSA